MSYEIKSLKEFNWNRKDDVPKSYRYTDSNNTKHITSCRSDIPKDAKEIDESTKVSEWVYNLIKYK